MNSAELEIIALSLSNPDRETKDRIFAMLEKIPSERRKQIVKAIDMIPQAAIADGVARIVGNTVPSQHVRATDLLLDAQEIIDGLAAPVEPVAAPPEHDPPETTPNQPTACFMSSKDLADHLHASRNAVDSVLRTFATSNPDSRQPVQTPKKREPRYMYRVEDVWPVLLMNLPRWKKPTTD